MLNVPGDRGVFIACSGQCQGFDSQERSREKFPVVCEAEPRILPCGRALFEGIGVCEGDAWVGRGKDHRQEACFVVVVPGGQMHPLVGGIGSKEAPSKLVETMCGW